MLFKKDAVLNLRYETRTMKSLPIIISGIIIMIFGIVFQFQGQGVIGPESSFMYENSSWINNGIYLSLIHI